MNAASSQQAEGGGLHPKEAARRILLDNDRVTVIETTYPVGGGVPMHVHRFPHVAYVIDGGQVETTSADGQATRWELGAGQALWRGPQSHSTRNVGSTPLRVVEVEVKGGSSGSEGNLHPVRPPPGRNFEPAFLREAIRLSFEKMQAGEGGPFGAVIVRQGEIVGRGWNRVTSTNDPTAHAEVMAIRDACSRLRTFSLAGCEIYSSCEPCPLCLAAIYWARLDRIYHAATCDDAAAAGFDDRHFYDELGKPAAGRRIGMEQALRDEALVALRAWMNQVDRIRY